MSSSVRGERSSSGDGEESASGSSASGESLSDFSLPPEPSPSPLSRRALARRRRPCRPVAAALAAVVALVALPASPSPPSSAGGAASRPVGDLGLAGPLVVQQLGLLVVAHRRVVGDDPLEVDGEMAGGVRLVAPFQRQPTRRSVSYVTVASPSYGEAPRCSRSCRVHAVAPPGRRRAAVLERGRRRRRRARGGCGTCRAGPRRRGAGSPGLGVRRRCRPRSRCRRCSRRRASRPARAPVRYVLPSAALSCLQAPALCRSVENGCRRDGPTEHNVYRTHRRGCRSADAYVAQSPLGPVLRLDALSCAFSGELREYVVRRGAGREGPHPHVGRPGDGRGRRDAAAAQRLHAAVDQGPGRHAGRPLRQGRDGRLGDRDARRGLPGGGGRGHRLRDVAR